MRLYHPGKMGMAEGIALIVGMSMSRMFLTTVTDTAYDSAQLGWLDILLANGIPAVAFLMLVYVVTRYSGDIYAVCRQLVGTPAAVVIVGGYALLFLAYSTITLRHYAEFTLLTALPRVDIELVILWYVVSVGIVCYLGLEAIARTSCFFMPLLVGGVLAICFLLSPFYVFENLTPWQGNGIMTTVKIGATGVGYGMAILIVTLVAPSFQDPGTIKRAVLYSLSGLILIKILIMEVYILVFGVAVGAELTVPFFHMSRLVYISMYVQRIESLFIVVWAIFGLLAFAVSFYVGLYLLALLLRLPAIRPIIVPALAVVTNLALLPRNIDAMIAADKLLIKVAAAGIYLFPPVLFIIALIRNKQNKSCAQKS